ncbi:MAG: hypothetical protein R2711_17920 [Acidimicrobiales bacterium]
MRKLGTNNLDCSNMCHESSGVALTQAIGIGRASPSTTSMRPSSSWSSARTQAPTTPACSPLSRRPSGEARRSSPSTPSPRPGSSGSRTPSGRPACSGREHELADEFVQVKVGADLALFQWWNRRLVELDDEARRQRARPRLPGGALRGRRRARRPPARPRRRRAVGPPPASTSARPSESRSCWPAATAS